MFDDDEPVLHPDDRPESETEAGPWLAILVGSVLAWCALATLDWRLLTDGTFLWATVRNTYVLVLSPLAAASLVQDTRALGTEGVEFGRWRWLYGVVTLAFPPVCAVYLVHRYALTSGGRAP